MQELKFFRTVVSDNRNYASIERIPDSYIELPHPLSNFEVQELRTLVEEHCSDVTIKFLSSRVDENTKYTLCIENESYLYPDKLDRRLEELAFIELSVKDFIATLCTPRF